MDMRSRFMFYRARSWSLKHRLMLLIKKHWVIYQERKIVNQFSKLLDRKLAGIFHHNDTVVRNMIGWYTRELAAALPQCTFAHHVSQTEGLFTVDYCIEFNKSLNRYHRRNYLLIKDK